MTSSLLKMSGMAVADKDEDFNEPNMDEASFRAALDRMGSRRGGQPEQNSREADSQPRLSLRMPADNAQARRRRFVRDGDIPVERHTLSRTPARTAHYSEEETADSGKARRALDEERRLREIAERQLHELQTSQRALETRLGHAEILVQELKAELAARQLELDDQTAELAAGRETLELAQSEIINLKEQTKKVAIKRPRYDLAEVDDLLEPQPVKWWKD